MSSGVSGGSAPTPAKTPESQLMLEAGVKEQRDAIDAEKSAAEQGARNLVAAQAAASQEMVAQGLKQQEFNQRQQQARTEARTRLQSAMDESSKVDTSIDPGRYWASRSTGGKIAGIIGLVLGAIGAGNDGVNRAAGMLDNAINRDLDAQKSEHELRLKKGAQAVEGAKSYYSLSREALQDDAAAFDGAKALALNRAAGMIDAVKASTQSQVALAQLDALKGKTLAPLAEHMQKAEESKAGRDMQAWLASQKKGAGANQSATAATLFDDLSAQWEKGGGLTGKLTHALPGTQAHRYEEERDATALAVATKLNGGKMPRPATIEWVKEHALPRPGQSLEGGRRKLRQTAELLRGGAGVPGVGEGEAEATE